VLAEDRIAKEVVDAAIKLHKQFGPGVYESVYEPLMVYELEKRGFEVRNQMPAPLMYDASLKSGSRWMWLCATL
jgi:GxxExxY protein